MEPHVIMSFCLQYGCNRSKTRVTRLTLAFGLRNYTSLQIVLTKVYTVATGN